MSGPTWVAFLVAAAVGAVSRFLLDDAIRWRDLPLGTFVINVTGSLILGVISGLALYHGLSKPSRLILGTGFCGAYTTFSTFSYETVRLIEEGKLATAARYSFGTLVVAGLAAAAGLALAAAV